MVRRPSRLMGAVLLALPFAFGVIQVFHAQEPAKASVTVDPVPGEAAVVVRITNLGRTALESWQIRLTYDLGAGPQSIDITKDTILGTGVTHPQSFGPVAPAETRQDTFRLAGIARQASATVVMLLFDDGTVNGEATEAAEVLAEREAHARALEQWLKPLADAGGQRPADGKVTLRRMLDFEDARAKGETNTMSELPREAVRMLLVSDRPDFQSRVAGLRRQFERHIQLLLEHKTRVRSPQDSVETPSPSFSAPRIALG